MQDTEKPVNTSLRQLIVRSTPEGFLFGKVSAKESSTAKLQLFAAVDFPDMFVSFLKENNWAKRPELKATVIDFTNRFMIVPNKLAEDESLEAFFNFQNGDEGEQQIYTAPLNDDKQLFCWEIPTERDRNFEKWLPNMTLWSTGYIIANWTYHQAAESDVPTLTAHFHGHHMQLFMADSDKLLFANTFIVRDSEEIAYFLLRCLEQMGLNPSKIHTFLCSENRPFRELQEFLAPYLANIFEAEFSQNPDKLFRKTIKSIEPEPDDADDDDE